MNYGKAIKTIRAAKGISQKELGKKLNLDTSYLSRIENEQRTPSAELLENIAKQLDVPFYLFILLSSEKGNLKGTKTQAIEEIGKNLLNALLEEKNG